jgi:hypothetical protein
MVKKSKFLFSFILVFSFSALIFFFQTGGLASAESVDIPYGKKI